MTVHVSALMEQHQHYKAVRAKLWGAGEKKPVAINHVKPEPPVVFKPLWSVQEIDFSHHVDLWRVLVRKCLGDLAASMPIEEEHGAILLKPRRESKLIIMEVLAHFKFITIKDLKGPRRETEVVRARQIAMYELHTQRDDLSYPGIGRIFGNRDHTTVLHAVRKIQAMKEAGTPVYPVDGKIIK
ncbi:hypothetical protein GGE68_001419 [Rhizobium leguminosarum]|uniref:helix-turn-helix domain-containing protein n=1 Tax=Rhizobium leguminosarum TaxID=384 RepID=UPI0016071FBE|nr:hypothetical protein [Rhizobium leguminosarum]